MFCLEGEDWGKIENRGEQHGSHMCLGLLALRLGIADGKQHGECKYRRCQQGLGAGEKKRPQRAHNYHWHKCFHRTVLQFPCAHSRNEVLLHEPGKRVDGRWDRSREVYAELDKLKCTNSCPATRRMSRWSCSGVEHELPHNGQMPWPPGHQPWCQWKHGSKHLGHTISKINLMKKIISEDTQHTGYWSLLKRPNQLLKGWPETRTQTRRESGPHWWPAELWHCLVKPQGKQSRKARRSSHALLPDLGFWWGKCEWVKHAPVVTKHSAKWQGRKSCHY